MQFWLKCFKKIVNPEKMERRAYLIQCIIWACNWMCCLEKENKVILLVEIYRIIIKRIRHQSIEWNYGKFSLCNLGETKKSQFTQILKDFNLFILEQKWKYPLTPSWSRGAIPCFLFFPLPISGLYLSLIV